MAYVNPYENPNHTVWIETGNCPAINRSKVWCNGSKNHVGDHWALHLLPGTKVEKVYWRDSENHPKPAKN